MTVALTESWESEVNLCMKRSVTDENFKRVTYGSNNESSPFRFRLPMAEVGALGAAMSCKGDLRLEAKDWRNCSTKVISMSEV